MAPSACWHGFGRRKGRRRKEAHPAYTWQSKIREFQVEFCPADVIL
jgi:hypothetical protein